MVSSVERCGGNLSSLYILHNILLHQCRFIVHRSFLGISDNGGTLITSCEYAGEHSADLIALAEDIIRNVKNGNIVRVEGINRAVYVTQIPLYVWYDDDSLYLVYPTHCVKISPLEKTVTFCDGITHS